LTRQGVFDPLDSLSRDWVGDDCIQCPRVYAGVPPPQRQIFWI